MFSWSLKKQDIVAQSTAETEFIVATVVVNQALQLKKILCDLYMNQKEITQILVDNQAAIGISHNLVFHERPKCFNIKLYFLREVQKNGEVMLIHYKIEDQ